MRYTVLTVLTSQRSSIFTCRAFRVFCAFKHSVIGVWHIGGLIPGELLQTSTNIDGEKGYKLAAHYTFAASGATYSTT